MRWEKVGIKSWAAVLRVKKKKKTQVIGTQSTADQRKPQFQDVPIGLKRYKITETHVERDHGRRVD